MRSELISTDVTEDLWPILAHALLGDLAIARGAVGTLLLLSGTTPAATGRDLHRLARSGAHRLVEGFDHLPAEARALCHDDLRALQAGCDASWDPTTRRELERADAAAGRIAEVLRDLTRGLPIDIVVELGQLRAPEPAPDA